jgi:hypothetical protein
MCSHICLHIAVRSEVNEMRFTKRKYGPANCCVVIKCLQMLI